MRVSTRHAAPWGAALLLLSARVFAQMGAPLIEAVDSSDSGRNVNVYTQLRCGARFLGQKPQAPSEGCGARAAGPGNCSARRWPRC